MRADGVTATLELALEASGCDSAKVIHKPRLPSDNGSSCISGDLADWIEDQDMEHFRGAPENSILLENYYLPGDLKNPIDDFVDHYNNRRYHESIGNLTPADVYFGRGQIILMKRETIKRKTIEHRRLQHRKNAA